MLFNNNKSFLKKYFFISSVVMLIAPSLMLQSAKAAMVDYDSTTEAKCIEGDSYPRLMLSTATSSTSIDLKKLEQYITIRPEQSNETLRQMSLNDKIKNLKKCNTFADTLNKSFSLVENLYDLRITCESTGKFYDYPDRDAGILLTLFPVTNYDAKVGQYVMSDSDALGRLKICMGVKTAITEAISFLRSK